MQRQSIDDGGWIDLGAATRYGEADYFDGQNRISRATGSQWDHEALYCSRSGQYVLNRWSQWQGSSESWIKLSASDAAGWLVENEHELPDGALADAGAAQEV
jgi:hypothetical protein